MNIITTFSVAILTLLPSLSAAPIHDFDFAVSALPGATLHNGATLSGGALNLDGLDDSASFSAKLIPVSGDFSVAIRARQLSLQPGYREMISQGSSAAPGFYIGHDPSHNFRVGDQWQFTGIPFPTDNEYHTYFVTRSVSATTLYIDGLSAASVAFGIVVAGGDNTRLGAQFQNLHEEFHGDIDHLTIWDTALSASDVATYGAPASVPETGPTAALLGLGFTVLLSVRRRYATA